MKGSHMKKQKGFTLVEMTIVSALSLLLVGTGLTMAFRGAAAEYDAHGAIDVMLGDGSVNNHGIVTIFLSQGNFDLGPVTDKGVLSYLIKEKRAPQSLALFNTDDCRVSDFVCPVEGALRGRTGADIRLTVRDLAVPGDARLLGFKMENVPGYACGDIAPSFFHTGRFALVEVNGASIKTNDDIAANCQTGFFAKNTIIAFIDRRDGSLTSNH